MASIEDISVSVEAIEGPISFAALFGNDRPVELEIGSGKGGFLLRQALAHPERNYFGIEWANKFCRFACDRMARRGIENVRLTRTDGRHFVIHRVQPGALDALHVYHPDPWPKKRHHKRRLITPEFVQAAALALKPGGRWRIQTDHAEYFAEIQRVTGGHSLLEVVEFGDADVGETPETNYEVKYVREGRPIYRLAFRRRGG